MKKLVVISLLMILFGYHAEAQRFITKSGKIIFFSDSPMEKIEAVNNSVNAALDIKSGMFVFKVLMKSFVFEKALMEEHFNENYVESDKYPIALFKGKVTNIDKIDFGAAGKYDAIVEGNLTMHGKTNKIKTTGVFTVYDEGIKGISSFSIKLADYGVEIPNIVAEKISNEILINVDINLKPLKK